MDINETSNETISDDSSNEPSLGQQAVAAFAINAAALLGTFAVMGAGLGVMAVVGKISEKRAAKKALKELPSETILDSTENNE